jgi:AraC family transcriptional regulator
LAKVMDFIEATLDREIHLTDLATIAGLSPFHFSRVFKLETGETPYHFVGQRRLERARLMLLGSDMPLAELALSCGFASQSHFTAAFSKAMGVSPGRYRRTRGR